MESTTIAFQAPAPIARPRHTAVLIGIFVVAAVAGALQGGAGTSPTSARSAVPIYLSLIAIEWVLVWFVARGIRTSGTRIRDLIGGRWSSPIDVIRDVALAAALWLLWSGIAAVWQRLHPADPAAAVQALLPRTPLEIILWIVLSLSAGFAEELTFRGYLQRQLHAFTGSWPAAAIGQALLFGIAHGYQGAEACGRIAVYGLLFAGLAIWRRSLRPGMLAHAWTDVAAGVLRL